jgi:hypothetical protein
MSKKISSDTIGNRSRDLPVCSAVPELKRAKKKNGVRLWERDV